MTNNSSLICSGSPSISPSQGFDSIFLHIPEVFVISTLVSAYPAGTPEIPFAISEGSPSSGRGNANASPQVGYKRNAFIGSSKHHVCQTIRASSVAPYYLDDFSHDVYRWQDGAIVQTLLLFNCSVTRADYLSGRTALHFAAVNGHVRCMRLVVADFVPSAPFESINTQTNCDRDNDSNMKSKYDQSALSKFVNKAADGGITALHMAALNGYSDCVQLLLDLRANVSSVTFHYGTSMDLIGAGSTPLHYAACGGNLKCCQILLARGASRLTLNCNGWLPLDVARTWGRHWLEPLLDPNSDSTIPMFPPSNYLSLPLLSVLNIAREYGLQTSATCCDDAEICAVCLERACTVAAEGCGHELCVRCALYLCSASNISSELLTPPGSIPCPLCRHGIISFAKLPGFPAKEIKFHLSLSLCTPCMLHSREADRSTPPTSTTEIRKNRVASVSSDLFCPVTCSPFPSVAVPLCTCSDEPCPCEPRDIETRDESPQRSRSTSMDQDKMEGMRLEKTSCSSMFWSKRSCSREHQCNSEINA